LLLTIFCILKNRSNHWSACIRQSGNLPDGYWKMQKLNEVKTLIEQCSGLFIDATSPEQFAVQTDSIRINLAINNRLGLMLFCKESQSIILIQHFLSSSTGTECYHLKNILC
jgi:hypothetical protein